MIQRPLEKKTSTIRLIVASLSSRQAEEAGSCAQEDIWRCPVPTHKPSRRVYKSGSGSWLTPEVQSLHLRASADLISPRRGLAPLPHAGHHSISGQDETAA